MVKNPTFYEAEVEAAGRMAENLPVTYESLHAEITLQEKLIEITDAITPKSEASFPIVAFDGESVRSLVYTLMSMARNGQPVRALPFENIEENIRIVEKLEELEKRAERELGILASIRKNAETSFSMFESSLMGFLDRIEAYFSEIRKLLKKVLFGGIDIHAKPTKEELENHGYAYVQHKYHVRLNSKYPSTSLVAIFQRHVDQVEGRIRGRVSEYIISMKREIKNAREDTRRLIELTRDKYKERIERKRERIKRLNDKIKIQENELRSLKSQIEGLIARAERYEAEADEYESRANWAETASERRSYLSRANRARGEANKLRNRAQRLYEKAMKIRAEYDANREKVAELEEEIEELRSEMEMKIEELKAKGERRLQEIQNHYIRLIRMVREDLDRFIDIRDEHLGIIESFYEKVIETELNYHKAPIEYRLGRLREVYSNLLKAIVVLEESHKQFIETIRPLKLDIPVEKPTLLYLPVWVMVSERGEERLIPLAVINESKKEELLIPMPSMGTILEGFVNSLKPDLLREAEKEHPGKVIDEGLRNLNRLVEMGILTEKDMMKIQKVLGG